MPFLTSLVQDLRYGLRTLARTPGFTTIAVAVLAIGIGVNTTVFTLANAFFFRPLPVPDSKTVVRVYANRFSNVRYPLYERLRDANGTLAGLAGFQLQSFALTLDADPEHAFGEIVTGNYFPLLGLRAKYGRLLGAADDVPGAPPAMVLSHRFWTRRFGGRPEIVGTTVPLNDVRFTIVGVADERFTGVLAPLQGDFWVPFGTDALLRPRVDPSARLDSLSLHLVGRLKPHVTREQAQADLDTIGRQFRSAAGEQLRGPAVTVYGSTMLHPEASAPVTAFTAVLMVVVGLVLLIVCVNVANLVLARAAGRVPELAVRQSLGAARARLIRQLLTENLLLAGGGAAGGLVLAVWITRLVMSAELPTPVPIFLNLSIDVRVLAFTTLVAVAATLAFGMIPALTASRVDLVAALKGLDGGRRRHGWLRSAFLVAQVALSILLLVTAGLFIRSYQAALSMDVGFNPNDVMTGSIDLETRGYRETPGIEFTRAIVERLEARPGIQSVNVVDIVPLTLSNRTTYLLRDGDVLPSPGQPPPTPMIYANAVGPGHFETLQIPLLAGRDFTDRDAGAAQQVAIVNETLARRFWPGKDAVGQRLRETEGSPPRDILVVGVVRNSKYVTVGEDERPFLFRPLAQAYTPHVTLLVRGAAAPAAIVSMMKQEVKTLDSGLSLFNIAPLKDATSVSLLPARVAGMLLSGLGILALVLAALGIYGVLSFLVRARTREIGIRVAIGATPRSVASLVVRQAMTWTVAGMAIGVALALALTRFLATFLYGISVTDPWTFGGVAMLLAAVAGVAALVPALRASRLDPLVALRNL